MAWGKVGILKMGLVGYSACKQVNESKFWIADTNEVEIVEVEILSFTSQ